MKICRRCDGLIWQDEAYETRPVFTPTGPALTNHLHEQCPKTSTVSGPAARGGEEAAVPHALLGGRRPAAGGLPCHRRQAPSGNVGGN